MVDAGEWQWITEHARGGFDHLLIGTSLPLIMAPALHYLEAWNEAVCDGAWGASRGARRGEDPPGRRPRALAGLPRLVRRDVRAAARGRRRPPRSRARRASSCCPATCTTRTWPQVGFPAGQRRDGARVAGDLLAVPQPALHEGAPDRGVRLLARRRTRSAASLARAAGVPPPPVRWRFQDGDPRFDNQVGTLELDGRRALARLERSVPSGRGVEHPRLEVADEHSLT